MQNFHLGRYIVEYTVWNFVLKQSEPYNMISECKSYNIPPQMKIVGPDLNSKCLTPW